MRQLFVTTLLNTARFNSDGWPNLYTVTRTWYSNRLPAYQRSRFFAWRLCICLWDRL